MSGVNVIAFDPRHSGLRCRGHASCRLVFRPLLDTLESLLLAGRDRDAHEVAVHGYRHVTISIPWSYQSTVNNRGRSTLGKTY